MFKQLLLIFLILICTTKLLSASDFNEEVFQSSLKKTNLKDQTRIGQGVYLLIQNGPAASKEQLMELLTFKAIQLTLSKGYDRLAIFGDVRKDGTFSAALQKAIDSNKVRKHYIRRIKQNPSKPLQARLVTWLKGGLVSSQKMYGIVFMMKGGKSGVPADTAILLPEKTRRKIDKEIWAAVEKRMDKMAEEMVKNIPEESILSSDPEDENLSSKTSVDYFFKSSGQ